MDGSKSKALQSLLDPFDVRLTRMPLFAKRIPLYKTGQIQFSDPLSLKPTRSTGSYGDAKIASKTYFLINWAKVLSNVDRLP